MRAILVSVNYADILSITLPYNRHHFSEVMVVTSTEDRETWKIARENHCQIFPTDSFWRGGAKFNKWLALEEGLDAFGREREDDPWLCLMDADVLWPTTNLTNPTNRNESFIKTNEDGSLQIGTLRLEFGQLCSPLRRMWENLPIPFTAKMIPSEENWKEFCIHRNVGEYAGYSQIFHLKDPRLPTPPWHETNWIHAGGADSFFQALWPIDTKIRPPFEVLHLGRAGENWMGRASPYLDGKHNPDSVTLSREIMAMWRERRRKERLGDIRGRFSREKLTTTTNLTDRTNQNE